MSREFPWPPALVQDPEILFLDEPTSYLDEDRARQFFEDLEKLPAATAVVLVEHRFELAAPFCEQWVRLANGVLEVQASPPVLWSVPTFPNGAGGGFRGGKAPESEAPILRVRALSHRYPEGETDILDNVDLP